jgi:hypothetical protein
MEIGTQVSGQKAEDDSAGTHCSHDDLEVCVGDAKFGEAL